MPGLRAPIIKLLKPVSPKNHLVEETVRDEWVFRGKLLQVRRDTVRLPDGTTTEREYIQHPGAVVIIAVTDSDELVMERQYRYPLRRDMIELPAGKIDPGEPPLATAKRELLEETGYIASVWQHLARCTSQSGIRTSASRFFSRSGLKQQSAKLDEEEFLEVFSLPLAAALEWVRQGKITDAKTRVGAVLGREGAGRRVERSAGVSGRSTDVDRRLGPRADIIFRAVPATDPRRRARRTGARVRSRFH